MRPKPHGVDVSQYNVLDNFRGLGFVMIRASSADGGLHPDTAVSRHVQQARSQHVPFGLYHFAANGVDPKLQASMLADIAHQEHALERGDIGLVVDAEGSVAVNTVAQIILSARSMLRADHVHRSQVGMYSGGWIKGNGGGTLTADWGWLADWTGDPTRRPVLPQGWHRGFTRLWQYAVIGGLDRDIYRGSHRSFRAWLDR